MVEGRMRDDIEGKEIAIRGKAVSHILRACPFLSLHSPPIL